MAREHSPRPGAHWQTVPVRREQVVPDDWTDDQPTPANRADRRAAKRALRKGQR